MALSVKHWNN